MTIIDANTVVVMTSSELKTVLEGVNTYTTIYFGANITLAVLMRVKRILLLMELIMG